MRNPQTTDQQPQTPAPQPGAAQVIPLYVNRPLYTDADIERAEVQEQAA